MRFKIDNHGIAVVVALIGMWLIGCAAFYLVFRSGEWSFLGLGGYDAGTLGQLGGFFLTRFGTQLPSAAFVAVIISIANFRRPLRAAFYTALGLQSFLLGLRALRWPWTRYSNLAPSIPVLGEFIGLSLIVGCTVLFTWLVTGPRKRPFRS